MSMRYRLNALIIGVLGLTLLAFVGMTILKAQPRVKTENENILRLSKDFLDAGIAGLKGASDREARLSFMLAELAAIRHLSVHKLGESETPAPRKTEFENGLKPAPNWFTSLVYNPAEDNALSAQINIPDYGSIIIRPDPTYEIAEIWDSILSLALSGLMLAAIATLFSSWIIEQTLRPLRQVGDALKAIEDGRYEVQVPQSGPPEVASLILKLNDVAARLKTKREENRELAQKVIGIQDQERRDLARELHDELGPYLFAIRAIATKLKSGMAQITPAAGLAEMCDTILARIDEVQQVNRRVLQKLRPAGLDELGLRPALEAFIALCKSNGRPIEVSLEIDEEVLSLDRLAQLTIYRIVQEGMTNAMRHSGADHIDVVIDMLHDPDGQKNHSAQANKVRVRVNDDGSGFKPGRKHGYGIVGMEERVLSLGGEVAITGGQEGGTNLTAVFPAIR